MIVNTGARVTGGQTIYNPWCLIGGVATATLERSGFLSDRTRCVAGDVLVLTKPLGTQVAANALQWLRTGERSPALSEAETWRLYKVASASMARLNRSAAGALMRHCALAATDVTGFGLRGHLLSLAELQSRALVFVVRRLPVLRGALAVDAASGGAFGLRKGFSAETSGGILAVLPRENAAVFFAFFVILFCFFSVFFFLGKKDFLTLL